MDEDIITPSADMPENQDKKPSKGVIFIICIILGLIATLAAWGAMLYVAALSFWLSVAGVLFSVAGLWVGRCCWRDIAITTLIAAGVLLLVHLIFNVAVDYALNSL